MQSGPRGVSGDRAQRVISGCAMGDGARRRGRRRSPVVEIDTNELDDPRYTANPSNRCYFCKSELWDRLAAIARLWYSTVAGGRNAALRLAGLRPLENAASALHSPRSGSGKGRSASSHGGGRFRRGRSRLRPVSRRAFRTELQSRSRDCRRSSGPSRRCVSSASPVICGCVTTAHWRGWSCRHRFSMPRWLPTASRSSRMLFGRWVHAWRSTYVRSLRIISMLHE
jgi:hypothetical protein